MRQRVTTIVGTAILGALALVFDYTLKFSGLKIPFPWFPSLKFDFTGIPIVMSLLMYGLSSGATTSSIVFLFIFYRSGGDLIGSSLKAIAEFSTVLGMAPFVNKKNRTWKFVTITMGLLLRIVIMSLLNLAVLPIFYSSYYPDLLAAVLFLPFLGAFNIIEGFISIGGGFLIYEAVLRRIPSIKKT